MYVVFVWNNNLIMCLVPTSVGSHALASFCLITMKEKGVCTNHCMPIQDIVEGLFVVNVLAR